MLDAPVSLALKSLRLRELREVEYKSSTPMQGLSQTQFTEK